MKKIELLLYIFVFLFGLIYIAFGIREISNGMMLSNGIFNVFIGIGYFAFALLYLTKKFKNI